MMAWNSLFCVPASFDIDSPCVKQCGVQSDSSGECQTVNHVNPQCAVVARPCNLPPCKSRILPDYTFPYGYFTRTSKPMPDVRVQMH